MKTKAILTLLLAAAHLLPIAAQDDARKVLDLVSKQLLSYQTLQADFTFTLSNEAAGIEDSFEGNLVMEGDKFRLSIMGMLIFCDGETLWNYNEEMNEASISDPDESDFFDPTQIFTLYQKDFTYEVIQTSGAIYDIKLIPKSENQEYEHIILRLDKAKKHILRADYSGTDGNTYLLKITNTIPDIQVDDRFFIFDPEKYPGVTVYDMR